MARDSNGSMTLAKPPFVDGVASSAPDMNAVLADIATELTDSLSRSGKGGLTNPLKFLNGTVSLPAMSFTSEPSSGWYRIAAGVVGLAVLGVERLRATVTGLAITGTLGVSDDVTLTKAGVQYIKHAGGIFYVGTTDSERLSFITNNIEAGYFDTSQNFNAGSHKIVSLADPAAAQDAATKAYVDARCVVSGRITGGTSAIISQNGSVTATATRTGVGIYSVAVAGLTDNAVITVSLVGGGADSHPWIANIVPGAFTVWAIVTGSSSDAPDVTFAVHKL